MRVFWGFRWENSCLRVKIRFVAILKHFGDIWELFEIGYNLLLNLVDLICLSDAGAD